MKLIVWLGNPWKEYKETRHNIWFILLDQYIKHNTDKQFMLEKKFLWEYIHDQEKEIIFLKPLTYMNLSGKSIKAVSSFFKIKPEDILVLHDEIDLANAHIKEKSWWGHAWHNWLKSMIQELWTNTFTRIRVWVWRPSHPSMDVSDHVLWKFSLQELSEINDKYLCIEELINEFITWTKKKQT